MMRPVGNERTTTGNVVRVALALTGAALIAAGVLTLLGAQIQGSKFSAMSNALGGKDIATGLGAGAVAAGALLVTGIALNTFGINRTKAPQEKLKKAKEEQKAAQDAATVQGVTISGVIDPSFNLTEAYNAQFT